MVTCGPGQQVREQRLVRRRLLDERHGGVKGYAVLPRPLGRRNHRHATEATAHGNAADLLRHATPCKPATAPGQRAGLLNMQWAWVNVPRFTGTNEADMWSRAFDKECQCPKSPVRATLS